MRFVQLSLHGLSSLVAMRHWHHRSYYILLSPRDEQKQIFGPTYLFRESRVVLRKVISCIDKMLRQVAELDKTTRTCTWERCASCPYLSDLLWQTRRRYFWTGERAEGQVMQTSRRHHGQTSKWLYKAWLVLFTSPYTYSNYLPYLAIFSRGRDSHLVLW